MVRTCSRKNGLIRITGRICGGSQYGHILTIAINYITRIP
jgi:hypothetical protein